MAKTTIIYYTDNSLEKGFEKKIQEYLIKAADGKRIISVSQKPMDFGDNICVGDIGRSHHSLFTQTLVGAEAADTQFMALAEHDCLYTPEHFNWIPPDDNTFYYNVNHWFVQWKNKLSGQYSYFRRKPMSQLICNRKLYIEAIKEKIEMLEYGYGMKKGQPGACEPGVCDNRKAFVELKAELARQKDVGKMKKYSAKGFRTEVPNIDVRHGGNFSGARRARQRSHIIEHWGSFYKVMGERPPGRWYQEATINGEKMPTRRKSDTNEKRWKFLIEPLIPIEGKDRVFTDLGCNAGFYCRKMRDLGFRTIGVEKEIEFIRHAAYWESWHPKGVEIVEADINDYELRCSQVVLLANVHYWLTKEELKKLVKQLRSKAMYVIIVGRYQRKDVHKSECDVEPTKALFEGWSVEGMRYQTKHYSILFKNPDLVERDTEEIFHFQQLIKSKRFLPSFDELVTLVKEGSGTLNMRGGRGANYLDNNYYKYLKWRRFRKPGRLYRRHLSLIKDTMRNGVKDPLTIGRMVDGKYEENRLYDGDHRLIIAKNIGIKKLLCKVRKPS